MNETAGLSWLPIPTCEVPPPVLEGEGPDPSLPRILQQAERSRLAERRLLLLAGLFAGLSGVLALILLLLPAPRTLVIHREPPARTLLGEAR